MPPTGDGHERRNFYRVLHLQPDAPVESVRAHYVALMTKLRAHPDLGGEHWNAAVLNAAYAVLRDPRKRAAYDRALLDRCALATVAWGGAPPRHAASDDGRNRRNYYRVLGAQNDAPEPVLRAAWQVLRGAAGIDAALVDEAWEALRDADRRRTYDALLREHGHAVAAALLPTAEELHREPPTDAAPGCAPTAPRTSYDPLITRFCAFCKAPHGRTQGELESEADCVECRSPLFPPPAALLELGRRVVSRIERDAEVALEIGWPPARIAARVVDVSPTGMRCTARWPLDVGDLVKIEGAGLRAVAEVAHRASRARAVVDAGLRFVTARFARERGGFLSIEV
ncbi:MAG: DnaJ domain-containing protein [Myxococcota bacterium]